jgi:hypothetical protein
MIELFPGKVLGQVLQGGGVRRCGDIGIELEGLNLVTHGLCEAVVNRHLSQGMLVARRGHLREIRREIPDQGLHVRGRHPRAFPQPLGVSVLFPCQALEENRQIVPAVLAHASGQTAKASGRSQLHGQSQSKQFADGVDVSAGHGPGIRSHERADYFTLRQAQELISVKARGWARR